MYLSWICFGGVLRIISSIVLCKVIPEEKNKKEEERGFATDICEQWLKMELM